MFPIFSPLIKILFGRWKTNDTSICNNEINGLQLFLAPQVIRKCAIIERTNIFLNWLNNVFRGVHKPKTTRSSLTEI